jgi:hypothetical protein
MMLVLLVAVADLRPDAGQPVQGVFIDDDLVAATPNGQAEKSLLDASFIPGNIDTSKFYARFSRNRPLEHNWKLTNVLR